MCWYGSVWPGDRGLMCIGSADLQSSVRSRSLGVHCLYVGRPDPANNKAVADRVAEDLEKSSKVLHLHNPIYRRLYPEWIYWKSMELLVTLRQDFTYGVSGDSSSSAVSYRSSTKMKNY